MTVDDQAWYGWDDHGRFRLHVEVGADSGMLIEAALAECHDRLFHERSDTGTVSTVEAVVALATRSIDAVPSASRRSRFRVNVHVDAATGVVTDGRGRRVVGGAVERILCDPLVSQVQVENGVPVSVGRSQHIVPDRTRRLVEHRDGGCRVPGCHTDRYVEVHHIQHWVDRGPTDTANLICLCPGHHRLHHQGRFAIVGDADRPPGSAGAAVFTDRHGTPIEESGARPAPPGGPPPPIEGEWEHPLHERLELRWLHFDEPVHRSERVNAAAGTYAIDRGR